MNYTAIRRSVHIRYTYADSSFAKGAFGDISELVFVSPPVSFFLPFSDYLDMDLFWQKSPQAVDKTVWIFSRKTIC